MLIPDLQSRKDRMFLLRLVIWVHVIVAAADGSAIVNVVVSTRALAGLGDWKIARGMDALLQQRSLFDRPPNSSTQRGRSMYLAGHRCARPYTAMLFTIAAPTTPPLLLLYHRRRRRRSCY